MSANYPCTLRQQGDPDHVIACVEGCHFADCDIDCPGCVCHTQPMGAPCAHCENYPDLS
jgi:hypothetical protein